MRLRELYFEAAEHLSETYSGEQGRARLIDKDGYDEEMLAHWEEAGTRTIKMGSSLPIHGVIGKFGLFRMCNLLGLVDAHVRGVGPDEARGGREWSEYTGAAIRRRASPSCTGCRPRTSTSTTCALPNSWFRSART
ncbi:MAG: hypothetical protein M5U35_10275 [Roseovarius sp.]|nr:hypothetical protein [Roseovarius sp.]